MSAPDDAAAGGAGAADGDGDGAAAAAAPPPPFPSALTCRPAIALGFTGGMPKVIYASGDPRSKQRSLATSGTRRALGPGHEPHNGNPKSTPGASSACCASSQLLDPLGSTIPALAHPTLGTTIERRFNSPTCPALAATDCSKQASKPKSRIRIPCYSRSRSSSSSSITEGTIVGPVLRPSLQQRYTNRLLAHCPNQLSNFFDLGSQACSQSVSQTQTTTTTRSSSSNGGGFTNGSKSREKYTYEPRLSDLRKNVHTAERQREVDSTTIYQ